MGLALRPCFCGKHRIKQGERCPSTRTRQIQRTTSERGYGARWQTASLQFRREYPLCGMRPNDQPPVMSKCHDDGCLTPAEQVDHVQPHRGDQRLFWDREHNWQSLCASCGARKSRAERHAA